ncbi:MAG: hypothetical protein HQK53_18195 [Oligoflexia bacterium]|nr:hypothetical protein [Oligoflexia bacterium]
MSILNQQKTRALIACDNQVHDLLLYSLETSFAFEVTVVNDINKFVQLMKTATAAADPENSPYSLLVCSFTQEANRQLLLPHLEEIFTFKQIAILLIGDGPETLLLDTIKSPTVNAKYLPMDKAILGINKYIIANFSIDKSYEGEEFSPISLPTLMRFQNIPFPVFLKLSSRYLKVLSVGDRFYTDDLNKYNNKGISRLYLKKRTSRWLLEQIDQQMVTILEDPQAELQLPDPPPEVLTENNSQEVPLSNMPLQDEATPAPAVATTPAATETDTAELAEVVDSVQQISEDIIKNSIGKPFQLDDVQLNTIKQNLSETVLTVKKNPEIFKLLKMLKINRDPDKYYVSHIGTLINISTAIASNMEWRTEKTIEKLVYASYFHDVGLSEKPELASIKTEVEAKQKNIPSADLKLFLSHPTRVAELLRGIPGFPEDVHLIVEQHHETPAGSGFPKKINATRITPMSAVFIVAHDLVDFIVENETWSITEYIYKRKEEYHGTNFRKIMQSLEKVKTANKA